MTSRKGCCFRTIFCQSVFIFSLLSVAITSESSYACWAWRHLRCVQLNKCGAEHQYRLQYLARPFSETVEMIRALCYRREDRSSQAGTQMHIRDTVHLPCSPLALTAANVSSRCPTPLPGVAQCFLFLACMAFFRCDLDQLECRQTSHFNRTAAILHARGTSTFMLKWTKWYCKVTKPQIVLELFRSI